MFVEYSKIGDSVFLTDDKGNIKRRDNTDNFKEIIMLENEKENADLRIADEKKEQQKFKNYRGVLLSFGTIPLISSVSSIVTSNADKLTPILTGTLLVSYGAAAAVTTGIVHEFNKKIKNINFYKKALDKEIKYELAKSRKVISKDNERASIDNNKNPLKLAYDKYELMHDAIVADYKMNNRNIVFPLFDEREKRIFSTIIEEEQNDTKKKVKVKEI